MIKYLDESIPEIDFPTVFKDNDFLKYPKACGEISCELKAPGCTSNINAQSKLSIETIYPFKISMINNE